MKNLYIFGSNGQDGRILRELLKQKEPQHNFILFNKNASIDFGYASEYVDAI